MKHHPVSTLNAYRAFGLSLGTFPPAVIFWVLFHLRRMPWQYIQDINAILIAISVLMLATCATVGMLMSESVARSLYPNAAPDPAESSTSTSCPPGRKFLGLLFLWAVLWGLVTGAAGGVFCFVLGVFAGPVFAIPISVLGFGSFGILHRRWECDGLIESRVLTSLVIGVTGLIVIGLIAAGTALRYVQT